MNQVVKADAKGLLIQDEGPSAYDQFLTDEPKRCEMVCVSMADKKMLGVTTSVKQYKQTNLIAQRLSPTHCAFFRLFIINI